MNTSLYIVATPIGNLGDMSRRALEALSHVDVILAEDTRVSSKLLNHFDIHTKLERCDDNVIAAKTPELIERMKGGEVFAFVSDAGTPGISDPGTHLVDKAREANLKIEAIPGPSAVIQALVLSGLGIDTFYFAGFPPRKKQAQIELFSALKYYAAALVFYESPYRVQETLENLAEVFPSRTAVLAREITKLHEEVLRMPLFELAKELKSRESVKGEIVLVVDAPRNEDGTVKNALEMMQELTQSLSPLASFSPEEFIKQKLAEGMKKSQIAKEVSRTFDINRDEAYTMVVGINI